MTQSTDTREGRRVLRVYRLYRARLAPYTAMRCAQDHFAWLTAQSVQCRAMDAAIADAQCFDIAATYVSIIHERCYRLPYWVTGKYTPPILLEVIDRCRVCRDTHEDHDKRLHLHVFWSSL